MTEPAGFKAIERRIKELLEHSGDISPLQVMALLKRAETSPSFDLEKELERLRTCSENGKNSD